MSDNKNMQDGRDRSQVNGNENYEVEYMAKSLSVTPEQVRDAIKAVGNDRATLEKYLKG